MLQLDVANFATTIWQQVRIIQKGRSQERVVPLVSQKTILSEACVIPSPPHFLQAGRRRQISGLEAHRLGVLVLLLLLPVSPTGQLTSSPAPPHLQSGLIPDLVFSPQMENLGIAPAAQPTQSAMPTFTSAFQRRAGGVLTTAYLQSFLEMAHSALQHLTSP